jgi:hypothetical protein
MAITRQHSAHPAADRQGRPAASRAGPASWAAVPLMGPADPGTAAPLMTNPLRGQCQHPAPGDHPPAAHNL